VTQVYGTNQPLAVTNMAFVNVPLAAAWPEGGILWLVWEMTNTVSKGQGLGIDNLVFSSGPPTLAITPGQPNLSYSTNYTGPGVPSVTVSWPQMFASSALVSSPSLGADAVWTPVGVTPTVWQGINYVTLPIGSTPLFFALEN
jgi:hypothetical protein